MADLPLGTYNTITTKYHFNDRLKLETQKETKT